MAKYEIPAEVYKTAMPIIHLQSVLADINDENIEESKEIILNLKLTKTQTGLVYICQDILFNAKIHFNKIDIYSKFVLELCKDIPNLQQLVNAKLLLPATDSRTKCVHLRMLRYFFEHETISLDEIITGIANFPEQLSNQYMLFFLVFGKFIERKHPDVFREICVKVKNLKGLGPTYTSLRNHEFREIITRSAESDFKWQIPEETILYGYVKESIPYYIRSNNYQYVRNLSQQQLDDLYDFSPFDPIPFESGKCTLTQIASISGSFKSLRHIMSMKAKIRNTDSNGNSPAPYAIAGGSMPIIKSIHERMIEMDDFLPLAAHCRAIDAFEYILSLIDDETKKKELLNKSLLECATTNNLAILLVCISYGASLKTKNSEGQTAIHLAALNDNLFIAKILSMLPNFNPNVQDDAGDTPLHLAAKQGNIGIINFLIGLPSIKKDIKNNYGKTALDATKE